MKFYQKINKCNKNFNEQNFIQTLLTFLLLFLICIHIYHNLWRYPDQTCSWQPEEKGTQFISIDIHCQQIKPKTLFFKMIGIFHDNNVNVYVLFALYNLSWTIGKTKKICLILGFKQCMLWDKGTGSLFPISRDAMTLFIYHTYVSFSWLMKVWNKWTYLQLCFAEFSLREK